MGGIFTLLFECFLCASFLRANASKRAVADSAFCRAASTFPFQFRQLGVEVIVFVAMLNQGTTTAGYFPADFPTFPEPDLTVLTDNVVMRVLLAQMEGLVPVFGDQILLENFPQHV
jgi:hypothetical protein